MNHLMSRSSEPEPVVGMGCTELMWTDRHAGTIVEVSANGRELVMQQDIATRVLREGEHVMSDGQTYSYAPNPNATRVRYTKRSNGAWVEAGKKIKEGRRLLVGNRQEYFDYSF
jgi:hypothetical protein